MFRCRLILVRWALFLALGGAACVSKDAVGFLLIEKSSNSFVLLYLQDGQVHSRPCGRSAIASEADSIELSELLMLCDSGKKRAQEVSAYNEELWSSVADDYYRSLSALYGVASRHIEKSGYQSLLLSFALGREHSFRTEQSDPNASSEEDRLFHQLYLSHDQVLQHLNSPIVKKLHFSNAEENEVLSAAVAAFTPVFSNGETVFRVLAQASGNQIDNSCSQSFDESWAPISIDRVLYLLSVPDDFYSLSQFVRAQLGVRGGKATPGILAWQDWLEEKSVSDGRTGFLLHNDVFLFDLDANALKWATTNASAVKVALDTTGFRTIADYLGYGVVFRPLDKSAIRPTLCIRRTFIPSAPEKMLPAGEITRAFLESKYKLSSIELYRRIMGCPELERDFAPLFLSPDRSMSQWAFEDGERKDHLECHLGVLLPDFNTLQREVDEANALAQREAEQEVVTRKEILEAAKKLAAQTAELNDADANRRWNEWRNTQEGYVLEMVNNGNFDLLVAVALKWEDYGWTTNFWYRVPKYGSFVLYSGRNLPEGSVYYFARNDSGTQTTNGPLNLLVKGKANSAAGLSATNADTREPYYAGERMEGFKPWPTTPTGATQRVLTLN